MPAGKSQLQGLKDLQQVGGKRAAPGARGGSGSRRNTPLPQPDPLRITGRKKPKIVHPKATTGIMSSEAVEKGVGGRKMGLSAKILFKV